MKLLHKGYYMTTSNAEMHTIKDIADFCNCSRPVILKHLKRSGYKGTTFEKSGRKIQGYALTIGQLKELKKIIENNKNGVATKEIVCSTSEAVTNTVNIDYAVKYFETKEELIQLKSDIKLLEDKHTNKEGLYIKEINELKTDKENLNLELSKEKAIKKRLNLVVMILSGAILVIVTSLIMLQF